MQARPSVTAATGGRFTTCCRAATATAMASSSAARASSTSSPAPRQSPAFQHSSPCLSCVWSSQGGTLLCLRAPAAPPSPLPCTPPSRQNTNSKSLDEENFLRRMPETYRSPPRARARARARASECGGARRRGWADCRAASTSTGMWRSRPARQHRRSSLSSPKPPDPVRRSAPRRHHARKGKLAWISKFAVCMHFINVLSWSELRMSARRQHS